MEAGAQGDGAARAPPSGWTASPAANCRRSPRSGRSGSRAWTCIAAQNHGGMGGAHFIDIMTMPGAGPTRGSMDFNFLDDALNARNAMTPEKGDEQLQQYSFSLSGTIKPNKTVVLAVGRRRRAVLLVERVRDPARRHAATREAAAPAAGPAEPVRPRRPHDHEGPRRCGPASTSTPPSRSNLGVGDFNLPERSYTSTSREQHAAPVGERPARAAVLLGVAPAGALDRTPSRRPTSRRARSA